MLTRLPAPVRIHPPANAVTLTVNAWPRRTVSGTIIAAVSAYEINRAGTVSAAWASKVAEAVKARTARIPRHVRHNAEWLRNEASVTELRGARDTSEECRTMG